MNQEPNVVPVELARLPDELQIVWSDDTVQRISYKKLRDRCPCARCMQNVSETDGSNNPLAVLPLEKTQPVKVVSMRPVGNYAYSISFSDGHNTGIYTFNQLLRLNS